MEEVKVILAVLMIVGPSALICHPFLQGWIGRNYSESESRFVREDWEE
jgi:hypothetical protein